MNEDQPFAHPPRVELEVRYGKVIARVDRDDGPPWLRSARISGSALPGVEGVRVVVPTREVTVRFDPGQLTRERIEATLEGAGYPVRQAPARPARRGHTRHALAPGPTGRRSRTCHKPAS